MGCAHRIRSCSGVVAMHEPIDIVKALNRDGLVQFEGLANPHDLVSLAQSIATIVPHRDSGPTGVTTISDRGDSTIRSGFIGFSASALQPHTDGSGVPHPPALLLTSCGVLVRKTALSPFRRGSRTRRLDLQTNRPRPGGGPPSTRRCGRLLPRGRTSAALLREVIARHAHSVRLEQGQGYLLHNHRWLHGRHAFKGRRVMYRVLANPLPHFAIASGFRPTCLAEPRERAGYLVDWGRVGQ